MPRKLSIPQNMEKSNEDKRTRNWNFILYPESAPENWRDIIDETRIEWVESPLHDQDKNEDGTEKKHHHHITLLYPGMKTFEQVEELTKSLNAPIPIKCMSVKGSIRYMVHKDNPEKHQYDWSKIVSHGGADLSALCAPTATERLQIQEDILNFIDDNDLIEYSDLLVAIRKIGNRDWLNVAMNFSTMSITAYIKSRRHKFEKLTEQKHK